LNVTSFVGRKYLGKEPLDAERLGHSGSCTGIVAGDHHRLNPQLLEALNCLLRGWLDRICDCHQSSCLPIDRNEHWRLALLGQRRRLPFEL
jgi:hypothetical protein